jgi:radical SAM superfamily enzyme YgiQ (UPF0313 family)
MNTINLVTTPIVDAANWIPPIGIAQLAGVLRQAGHKTLCIDLNSHISNELDDFSPDFLVSCPETIGAFAFREKFPRILDKWIECVLANQPRVIGLSVLYRSMVVPSLALAIEIKKRSSDITVIMGGSFATTSNVDMIQRLIKSQYVDLIAIGYGEVTILEILRALFSNNSLSNVPGIYYHQNGKVYSTALNSAIDLNSIPFPDFENLLNPKAINSWMGFPIHGSRGCINSCSFCNVRHYKYKFQQRSADHIYSEILNVIEKYKVKRIAFTDNLINGVPSIFKSLCRMLKKTNLDVSFFGSLALMPSVTEEMLDLIQEAKFDRVLLALESPSPRIRKDMLKWTNMQSIMKIFNGCINRKIKPTIFLMHSFPTEAEKDFQTLLHFVDDWNPNDFDVLTWPFRLADVRVGKLDDCFVDRFNIEILEEKGIDLPHYWKLFGQEPKWRTKNVDEDIRLNRQNRVEKHLKLWRLGKE